MGFFTPVWMNANKEKALAAIAKLATQNDLIKAATTAPDLEVRGAAVSKITDEPTLAFIAENGREDKYVRVKALQRLNNHEVLRRLAQNDLDIQSFAIKRLDEFDNEDQAVLIKIAMEEREFSIKAATLGRMSDKSLEYVIQNCPDFAFCLQAHLELFHNPHSDTLLFWGPTFSNPKKHKRRKAKCHK